MRRRGLTSEQVDEAIRLYGMGWSVVRVGQRLGVDGTTVLDELRERGARGTAMDGPLVQSAIAGMCLGPDMQQGQSENASSFRVSIQSDGPRCAARAGQLFPLGVCSILPHTVQPPAIEFRTLRSYDDQSRDKLPDPIGVEQKGRQSRSAGTSERVRLMSRAVTPALIYVALLDRTLDSGERSRRVAILMMIGVGCLPSVTDRRCRNTRGPLPDDWNAGHPGDYRCHGSVGIPTGEFLQTSGRRPQAT